MLRELVPGNPTADLTLLGRSLADYEAVISNQYAPLELTTDGRSDAFDSRFDVRSLGWMQVSRAFAGGRFAGRRQARRSTEQSDELILMLVEDGRFSVRQHDRVARCGPNDLVIQDCDGAMEAEQEGPTNVLGFKMPKKILMAHHRQIDGGFARAVNAQSGSAAILRDLMLSVWRNYHMLSAEELRRLPGTILSLAGLVFFTEGEVERDNSSMAFHFNRIERAVALNLPDPDLSPGSVAEELGISKSYLFAVTNWAGQTFRRMVIDQRLEMCRKALADPGQSQRSITDIAFGWGFQNSSHFSRSFLDKYEMAPSQYRQSSIPKK